MKPSSLRRTSTSLVAVATLASIGLTAGCSTTEDLRSRAGSTATASHGSAGQVRQDGLATSVVDLRADTNRDGRVDVTGASDEAVEESEKAVFLPNLDDDASRCAALQGSKVARNLCSDAADDVVNGAADAADLAEVRSVPMAGLPDTATGKVKVTEGGERVRLFLRLPGGWSPVTPKTTLNAAQLRAGVQLGLEGRDILRDPKKWSGIATVELAVTTAGHTAGHTAEDAVSLQVAPILTTDHTMPLEQVLVSQPDAEYVKETPAFNAALARAVKAAGVPHGLRQLPKPYITYLQDAMEQVYVEMPSANAPTGQQSLNLLMVTPSAKSGADPLPVMKGPGVGMLWLNSVRGESAEADNPTYEIGASGGNIETLPAYSHEGKSYPNGRVMIGTDPKRDNFPAVKALVKLIGDQGRQTPLEIDISYLSVGHVDEVVQVLPVANERGWTLAVADPRGAMELLKKAQQDGAGKQVVVDLPGKYKADLDQAIDPQSKNSLVKANEFAAEKIDANIERLKEATGITDAEIVRIPVLYREIPFEPEYHVSANLPAAINSLVTSRTSVLVASQKSVRVAGKDVFEEAIAKAYDSVGYQVTFIDDTHLHQGSGDVHCGTNAIRLIPPQQSIQQSIQPSP